MEPDERGWRVGDAHGWYPVGDASSAPSVGERATGNAVGEGDRVSGMSGAGGDCSDCPKKVGDVEDERRFDREPKLAARDQRSVGVGALDE